VSSHTQVGVDGRTTCAADLSIIGMQMWRHAVSFNQLYEVEGVQNNRQDATGTTDAHAVDAEGLLLVLQQNVVIDDGEGCR